MKPTNKKGGTRPVRYETLDQIMASPDLPHVEKIVAYILVQHMGDKSVCWPSMKTIANATGLSVRTVERTVPRLMQSGWFTKDRKMRHGGNRYRLGDGPVRTANSGGSGHEVEPPTVAGLAPSQNRQLGGCRPANLKSEPPTVAGVEPPTVADRTTQRTTQVEPPTGNREADIPFPDMVGEEAPPSPETDGHLQTSRSPSEVSEKKAVRAECVSQVIELARLYGSPADVAAVQASPHKFLTAWQRLKPEHTAEVRRLKELHSSGGPAHV